MSLTDNRESWNEALEFSRPRLHCFLDYLIECHCGSKILANVEAQVRNRSVSDEFKFRFLVRSLMRSVIQHFKDCPQHRYPTPGSLKAVGLHRDLSSEERLVFLMRDVLEYSTRDTSLLIGMTDAQVESTLRLARKRIDMTEGPSTLAIHSPQMTYFRWRFTGDHLG